jgi:hypothetical protein
MKTWILATALGTTFVLGMGLNIIYFDQTWTRPIPFLLSCLPVGIMAFSGGGPRTSLANNSREGRQ